MNKTTRIYKPGEIITLFDSSKNSAFEGVLYFDQQEIDKAIKQKVIKRIATHSKAVKFKKMAVTSLAFSIFGFFLIILPVWLGGNIQANQASTGLSDFAVVYKDQPKTDALNQDPVIDQFELKIPKIDLTSDVLPNVDPNNEAEYKDKLLKYGVAHAKGSYLPGTGGMTYLFAHSTDSIADIARFNAKFFYINNLQVGDEIDILFKGKKYVYKVKEKKIINPTQLDEIRNIKADVVLQTCWPLGTSWQRLLIIADQESVQ